jgi:hypothetical protein
MNHDEYMIMDLYQHHDEKYGTKYCLRPLLKNGSGYYSHIDDHILIDTLKHFNKRRIKKYNDDITQRSGDEK